MVTLVVSLINSRNTYLLVKISMFKRTKKLIG
jgi:hypothetical protein